MAQIPVVSYARISADVRRDEHGVQDQHKLNRETAARLGWKVVHEYTDNDKSAAKADVVRDDFEAMLKALRAGELPDGTAVQGVVIVAEDRLARRPGDYERFAEAITYQDGRVFADARGAKDLYNEDAESMGLFGAVISKMEVRKMQRRMRRSHRTRAEQGMPVGGTRPFGWKPDRLTLDPVEAPLVRQAVLDLISGRSLYSIAEQWRRDGVKTSLGNAWTPSSLKITVNNPRICGWREISKELVRGADGNPVVGQWEAIVTPEQWMAVKSIFDARKGHYIHRDGRIGHVLARDFREPNYLLTGFLRCGRAKDDGSLCNTSLRVTHSKDCVQHIYICPGKTVGGCGGLGRRGDMVDLYISEAVLAKLEEAQLASSDEPSDWPKQDEYDGAKDRLDVLRTQWTMGKVSNDLFFSTAAELEKQIARLRTEAQNFTASIQRQRSRSHTDVSEIRRRWFLPEEEGGLPLTVKRTYVREALHAVIIYPSGKGRAKFNPDLLEPVWREG
ncbi:recombinase family protein [Nonomuraea endophytica]|uniref:DNA invertase Pin-like site-specific DNA recombinase n=1 Tax=Nonomuraea endophytica TaxID=714136 RepID=A0A7W7ZYB5_9ACTN|nr:recombinase family protein [Nonomuraea endophytica]MBB5075486.1 DNA invertase Pin-like site-specific DNA recombinase [Nonomuraea endophytica]